MSTLTFEPPSTPMWYRLRLLCRYDCTTVQIQLKLSVLYCTPEYNVLFTVRT